MKLSKIFCYFGIVLLIGIILTPPLLRVFYKDEKKPAVVDKFSMLSCSKENYTIGSSYKNNEILNMKFKHPIDDPNLKKDTNYELEYSLSNLLKDKNDVVKEEETINVSGKNISLISYFLVYSSIKPEFLTELTSYKLPINDQKKYYESNGYTCSIIEN